MPVSLPSLSLPSALCHLFKCLPSKYREPGVPAGYVRVSLSPRCPGHRCSGSVMLALDQSWCPTPWVGRRAGRRDGTSTCGWASLTQGRGPGLGPSSRLPPLWSQGTGRLGDKAASGWLRATPWELRGGEVSGWYRGVQSARSDAELRLTQIPRGRPGGGGGRQRCFLEYLTPRTPPSSRE